MVITTLRPGGWNRSITLILGAAFACHGVGLIPHGPGACCLDLGSRTPLYVVVFYASSRVQIFSTEGEMN